MTRTPTNAELTRELWLRQSPLVASVAADAAEDAAGKAEQAAAAAAEAADSVPKPDPRDAPHFELLQPERSSVFARINARRNRWPELQAIDQRISDNDGKHAQLAAELTQAHERRSHADAEHAVALSNWYADARRGNGLSQRRANWTTRSRSFRRRSRRATSLATGSSRSASRTW